MRVALAVLGVSLVAGCSLAPTKEENATQAEVNNLDARMAKVERVISNQSLVDMSQRLGALEAQVRTLQGAAEVEANSLEGLQKQQRDLYADIEARIAALESGIGAGTPRARSPADAASAGAAGAAAGGSGPGEQQTYDDAFAALKDARYGDAIAGFRLYLETWPAGALAPNSQYWLGEAYYVTRDYESAEKAFGEVAGRWPNSAKAPGALLKQGFAEAELKQYDNARETFREVIARYPDTEAAKLAQDRLKRLPVAPQ